MTTQYTNQSVQYTDIAGNTATLTPDVGLVLSNGVTTLTMDQTGFTNGVQTLLFQDIYTTVGKTESIPYLASTSTKLSVVDTIEVLDAYPLVNDTTTITPTQITINDSVNLISATLANNQLNFLTGGTSSTYEDNGLTIDDGTNIIDLRGSSLNFDDNTTANASYRLDGATISNAGGYFCYVDPSEIRFTASISTNQSFLQASTLTLTDGTITNTLDKNDWTGNIRSENTTANLTHYLGFFDNSATGYGHPQKNAVLSCNPSTNTITATTFSGNATSSSTAVGVNLTSDNTSGTYFLPFSKTASVSGNVLYIDNATGPLSYNPSTSNLTASLFSGNIIWGNNQNTATFAGTTLTISGALSGASISVRNSSIVITGGSNTISALTLNNMVSNGVYKVGILNNGTGNLTVNTGLGANIRTRYSGAFNIASGRYGFMTIDVIVINTVTNYIVDAVELTN